MPRKQLASLLVIVVWIAAFTPFGNSVYNPTPGDVQELGGEKAPTDEPKEEPPPPDPDEES